MHPVPDGTLLLMPAWGAAGGLMGIKLVTVFPGNRARGLASVGSSYLLCDADTGQHLALLDGDTLTARRTAAASALAASFLARPDAAHLLVVGAGHVAALLPEAYAAIRPLRRVTVWNRSPAGAAVLAERWRAAGLDAHATTDLPGAVAQADIVSCATLATAPLVHGAWIRPGTHLDLIGGFTPAMREADEAAVRGARAFVDTHVALAEAGDLAGLTPADLAGSLTELCRGAPGRISATGTTLFKSVGTALEDLAAAGLLWRKEQGP